MKRAIYLLLALLKTVAVVVAGPAPTTDVIQLDKQHQTIENFGASEAWRIQRIGGCSLENWQKVPDLLGREPAADFSAHSEGQAPLEVRRARDLIL